MKVWWLITQSNWINSSSFSFFKRNSFKSQPRHRHENKITHPFLLCLRLPDLVCTVPWSTVSLKLYCVKPLSVKLSGVTWCFLLVIPQKVSPLSFRHCLGSCLCAWNISNEFKLNPEPLEERRSCRGKRIKLSLRASPFISTAKERRTLLCSSSKTLPEKIKNSFCHSGSGSDGFSAGGYFHLYQCCAPLVLSVFSAIRLRE